MTTAEDKQMIVAPFTIEADHPRNDDLLIQAVPGLKLRSAIDGSKPIKDVNGEDRVPLDQSRSLASFPKTPGMRLHVDPAALEYTISDPLNEDPKMCDRVKTFLTREMGHTVSTVTGVETTTGVLDEHRMKTLCREIIWLLEAKEAKIVKGPRLDMADVEDLPGKFLLNPGSRVTNSQPVYESEWADWVAKLSTVGG